MLTHARVRSGGGADVSLDYTYDGSGLRQSRARTDNGGGNTTGAATEQLTWDANGGLPVLLEDGTHRYLYGPSATPYAQVSKTDAHDSTAFEYLHCDVLGSVRLITDDDGTKIGATTYSPYGTVTEHTGTATSAIGYTGNLTDPDTGLIYLRARDYQPSTGQFLTIDPAVDTTHQPYAYVDGNPITRTDPTGLCWGPDAVCNALHKADDWLADNLRNGAGAHMVSFLEGAANAATFGGVNRLVDTISPGASCTYKRDGWYTLGEFTGEIITSPIAGSGAARAANLLARGMKGLKALRGARALRAGEHVGDDVIRVSRSGVGAADRPLISLARARSAAESRGIDTRLMNLRHEAGASGQYGFTSFNGAGKLLRGANGRFEVTLTNLGLRSEGDAVNTIAHELNHIREAMRTGGIPPSEAPANLAGNLAEKFLP